MKRQTISTRWRVWAELEPLWAYAALICFLVSMAGLGVHLWVLHGVVRQAGLVVLIAGDAGALAITGYRRQWWWHSFFWYVTAGVVGWEIASYFFGSQLP